MIRLPAEWEEQESILLTLPNPKSDWRYCLKKIHEAYINLIQPIAAFQKCIVLTHDISYAKNILPTHPNIECVQVETNDTWIRDFGALDFEDDKVLKSYDFTFNGWGGKYDGFLDNTATQKLYQQGVLQGDLLKKDFVLEGGSIDSNGKGTLLTTSACIFNPNRNPHFSQKKIEHKLIKYFGLQRLIVLHKGSILGDDTDSHIDTLARFINTDTIAYATCKDKNDPHFEPLKQMERELQKTKLNLLALPIPQPIHYKQRRLPATYINFIFINGGLIVPTYNDKNDKIALEKLQNALPSLKVVGVDARVFIRENGSLHCASINRFKGQR